MLHLDIFTYDTVSKSRWNWPMYRYATFATFNFHNILRMLQHNFRDFVIAHSRNKIYPKNDSVTANWNHSSYIVLYCDHAQTSDWLIIQIRQTKSTLWRITYTVRMTNKWANYESPIFLLSLLVFVSFFYFQFIFSLTTFTFVLILPCGSLFLIP